MKKAIASIALLIGICCWGPFVFAQHRPQPEECGKFLVPDEQTYDKNPTLSLFPFTTTIALSPVYTSFTAGGATSGTSGCHNGTAHYGAQRANYIASNYEYLSHEASQGTGLHLAALGVIIGCPPEQSTQFSKAVQRHYQQLFLETPKAQPIRFLQQLNQVIATTPQLKQTCRIS